MKPSPFALFDLTGYLKWGSEKIITCDNKRYAIQRYQGEHKDEYTVMEIDMN